MSKFSMPSMGLRAKMLLFILSVCIVMYLGQILYSGFVIRRTVLDSQKELLLIEAQKTALNLSKKTERKKWRYSKLLC